MMSWLEDLNKDRVYNYKSGDKLLSGTLSELSEIAADLNGEYGEEFIYEGDKYVYAGFEPVKSSQMTSVMYEQNGRKAYKITDPSGKIRYIAKSKHDYLKHGEINGQKLKRRGQSSIAKGSEL
jgi:hypothetical protein